MSAPPVDPDGHPSDVEIAAYLDHGLPPAERSRLESHLADCATCRQHVIDSRSLVRRVRRPQRMLAWGGIAAAAAVAGAWVMTT